MIEVGDLVRIKNEYLRTTNTDSILGGLFARSKWRRKKGMRADGTPKPWKYRGKQQIARVVRIVSHTYDWRHKEWNTVVELDIPDKLMGGRNRILSTKFLVVHRKAKSKIPSYFFDLVEAIKKFEQNED